MQIIAVIIIFNSVISIQACGTTIKTMRKKRGGEIDWVKWDLPPYNDDWRGFVDLLGTREVIEKTTTKDEAVVTEDYENDPDWPKRWKDLGIGNAGSAPPKWAHLINDVGQPPVCLQRPDKGNGINWYLRWYYDAHRGRCRRFVYTGSGGNVNRFISQSACKRICADPPTLPCVPDRLFNYAAYLNIQRRFIIAFKLDRT